MWYRVKIDEDRFFMDEAHYIDLKNSGKEFELETKNRWLSGVAQEFPDDTYDGYTDGMVLDEIVKLIDEGVCNA